MVDIHAIDAYIFCESLLSVIFSYIWSIFFDLYAQVLGFSVFQWNLLSKVFGFGKFVMKWSSDPHLKHLFGFRPLHSLHLLLELHGLKGSFLIDTSLYLLLKAFLSWVWNYTVNSPWLRKICYIIISYWIVQNHIINFESDIDNDFDKWIFILFSIIIGGLLSEQSNVQLDGNCTRNGA